MSITAQAPRVLIVGGTGNLGTELVRAFQNTRNNQPYTWDVYATYRSDADGKKLFAQGANAARLGDVTDIKQVRALVEDFKSRGVHFDAVVMNAGTLKAKSRGDFFRINADGPENVTRALAESRDANGVSMMPKNYLHIDSLLSRNEDYRTRSHYADSKRAGTGRALLNYQMAHMKYSLVDNGDGQGPMLERTDSEEASRGFVAIQPSGILGPDDTTTTMPMIQGLRGLIGTSDQGARIGAVAGGLGGAALGVGAALSLGANPFAAVAMTLAAAYMTGDLTSQFARFVWSQLRIFPNATTGADPKLSVISARDVAHVVAAVAADGLGETREALYIPVTNAEGDVKIPDVVSAGQSVFGDGSIHTPHLPWFYSLVAFAEEQKKKWPNTAIHQGLGDVEKKFAKLPVVGKIASSAVGKIRDAINPATTIDYSRVAELSNPELGANNTYLYGLYPQLKGYNFQSLEGILREVSVKKGLLKINRKETERLKKHIEAEILAKYPFVKELTAADNGIHVSIPLDDDLAKNSEALRREFESRSIPLGVYAG